MPGDYRIFVGAFPTGDFVDRVQALRKQRDPKTARITPPHVTLAETKPKTSIASAPCCTGFNRSIW